MGSKLEASQDDGKSDSNTPKTNTSRIRVNSDEIPPVYYDSEPSAQPPKYPNNQSTSCSKPQIRTTSQRKPPNQHRNSAPASTIAAVLASGYDDLDAQRRADRKKKTLRERWRDFKERNFGDYDVAEDRAQAGSAAEWNIMGGKTSGGLASPYQRKGGK